MLRRLDLEQAFATTGIRPDAFVSRAWDSGETLYRLEFDEACERRFGGPFVNIHRADLHELLQQPLKPGTIRYGHKLAGIDETAHGVTLSFDNGATAEADIAIGADGIRSKVREIMLGAEEPRFHRSHGAARGVSGGSDQGRADRRLHQMVGGRPPRAGVLHDRAARRGLRDGCLASRALGWRRFAGARTATEFTAPSTASIAT